MYHKICLCFGIGIEFEIMSVATDKASFRHATVVIHNKMIVVGGESESGLLDDVQIYERGIVGSSYKLRSIQFSEKALLRFHIYIHISELVTFYFCKNNIEYHPKFQVPLQDFNALQGISGAQRFQIHKGYESSDHLSSSNFNQLDLPEYPSKQHLEGRLLLAIHEANEGFGFVWSFDTYTECWSPMETKVES
ncbi:E3 ubiquitin-protein ligase UPL2 [Glycine max]|nr:E3 ubiquitin-protein ligase UPL2 [Glycine max]